MEATIQLVKGRVNTEDLHAIKKASEQDCVCTPQMREGLEVNGEQVTCKPCAARGIINSIVTLARKL